MTEGETVTRNNVVAVIVDRDFGDRLVELAQRVSVWIVTSKANRPAVESIWAEHKKRPSSYGVTVFIDRDGYSAEDLVFSELERIDEHYPSWSVMEMYGVERTPLLSEEFREFGVTSFEDRAGGFVATRTEQE